MPTKPYKLGQAYRTRDGSLVTIVAERTDLPGYESVQGDDGLWRYNLEKDRGRVTASAHDFSHPKNLLQEPLP